MKRPHWRWMEVRGLSLRWKLLSAFGGVNLFVAAFVVVAIAIQIRSNERAARLEATHIAELVAARVKNGSPSTTSLQDYISRITAVRKRDFVVVDANQKGVADANPFEIGMTYNHDLADQVGKTIRDGKTRTFIEQNVLHLDKAYQLVIPITQESGLNTGAVIVEYSQTRDELFTNQRPYLYLLSGSGVLALLLITFFGLDVARRIAKPLTKLKDGVQSISRQDYSARVVTTSRDEIGLLGAAFNHMAEDLAGRAELIASNDQLEREIAERKLQLSESVSASLVMTEEMERTQEAVEVAHRKISYLGQFDPVTGLANQSLFQERLQQRLIAAMLEQQKAAVIVLEIERFDAVVHAFGRKGGDELLERVAERMVRAGAGEAIRFALVGPARFAIAVADVGNPEQIGRYLEQRLAFTFRPPFAVQGSEIRLSVKIGIALFPADGADAETLFRNAESALKRSKRTGEKYLFFAQEMTERVAERLSLESRLRDAVDNEDFVLYYQPKFTLATKKVVGAEALIRWNSQGHGLVAPNVFIPILEETGLINDVGRWVLRTALADYARWRAAGLPAVRIAVNVSPTELKSQGFVAQIEALLEDDANLAEGLELEITESVIMDDVERNIAVLQAIRDLGVTIAIDDFGTGYSSLSYLAKLPVDILKIDRSFISGMTTTPGGQSLIAAIITLAHSLSLRVVAEGVETEEQSRLLQMLECDEVQGYLFGRPEPGGEFRQKYLTRRMLPARHPSATSSV